MKNIRLILFIFLFSNLCLSQTGWYQLNSGTNKTLYSICFINLNTGFAAGDNGVLLKTVTTGITWTPLYLNDTASAILKIYFKDQSTGFALAYERYAYPFGKSKIYMTTNSGLNWSLNSRQFDYITLKNIHFINSNTGFISTGYSLGYGSPNFFKTVNGGLDWQEVETEIINSSVYSIRFINENTGFIGTERSIYKTINGGNNWSEMYSNEITDCVSSIVFLNNNIGFACGGKIYSSSNNTLKSFILKTLDGGNSWYYLYKDSAASLIEELSIYSEQIIYGCGSSRSPNAGLIIKTSNGGIEWRQDFTSANIYLNGITNSNTKGFAVGLNGAIYKKDNIVSVTQISTSVPSSINLYQNYPNPFNPETTIKFDLAKSGLVTLKVYDISGKEIQNLLNGVKEAGSYQLKFDGASLNSGVYFYKLMTNGTTITKSMVLLK